MGFQEMFDRMILCSDILDRCHELGVDDPEYMDKQHVMLLDFMLEIGL
jgi:hypothetical protein